MRRSMAEGLGSTEGNIARQRRLWNQRAVSWDHGAQNNPGLVKVVERVLAEAAPTAEMVAVDLGCGSGQLTLKVAPKVASVLAVDVSQSMIDLLGEHAWSWVSTTSRDVPRRSRSSSSLRAPLTSSSPTTPCTTCANSDKRLVVDRCASWLRPGGRLVIGDMMFGRGGDPREPCHHRLQALVDAAQRPRRLVPDREERRTVRASLPGAARLDVDLGPPPRTGRFRACRRRPGRERGSRRPRRAAWMSATAALPLGVGIDVGGTKILAVALEEGGGIVAEARASSEGAAMLRWSLEGCLTELCRLLGEEAADIAALCLGSRPR